MRKFWKIVGASEDGSEVVSRAKVPGGWLYQSRVSEQRGTIHRGSVRRKYWVTVCQAMVFVPKTPTRKT